MPQRPGIALVLLLTLMVAPAAARAQESTPQVRAFVAPATVAAGEVVTIYADVTLAPDALDQDIRATFDPIAIGLNKFVTTMDATSYAPDRCPAGHACFVKMYVSTDVYATGTRSVSVTVTDANRRTATGTASLTFTAPVDADDDGLPDVWEGSYGLSTKSDSGNDGPGGDPDGDGVTNLQEYHAHSNPLARYTQVFAEGSYGDRQLLMNCYSVSRWEGGSGFLSLYSGRVRVLAIGDNGRTFEKILSVYDHDEVCPLGGQFTAPSQLDIVSDRIVAVFVESFDQMAVERVTREQEARGSQMAVALNSSLGVQNPSPTWYFARGAAGRNIDLFYLMFNPGTEAVQATVSFSGGPGDRPVQYTRTLPPGVRTTIWVNQDVPAAAAYDAAATITASNEIYVERAWRYQAPGRTVPFDSVSRGAPATSTTWYFAAGALSASFDTSFAIMNPSDATATVTAQFLRTDADPVSRTITVPAHGRSIVQPRDLGIGGADIALSLTSADGVGIVAERTTDGATPSGPWRQSNLGATSTGTAWSLASAHPGSYDSREENNYVVANLSDVPGQVRVQFGISEGTATGVYDLPARRVVVLRGGFTTNWATVTSVQTTGNRAPDIVVERATSVAVDDVLHARQVTVFGNVTR